MNFRSALFTALASALLVAATTPAIASTLVSQNDVTTNAVCSLGAAADFGSFTLRSTTVRHTDISGRVAVGENLFVNHFAVGCAAYAGHKAYELQALPREITANEASVGTVTAFSRLPSPLSFSVFVNKKYYRGFGTSCGRLVAFDGFGRFPGVTAPYEELGTDAADYSSAFSLTSDGLTAIRLGNYRQYLLDFPKAKSLLTQRSQFFASLAATGTATYQIASSLAYSLPDLSSDFEYKTMPAVRQTYRLELVGTDAKVNVFHVNGTDLLKAREINISVPTGATALINVSGGTVVLSRVTIGGNNLSSNADRQEFAKHVLWNFYEALDVYTISYASKVPFRANELLGTFLAPYAAVHLASKIVDVVGVQRHIYWMGSLVIGTVISDSLNIRGLSDNNFAASNDDDSQPGDIVEMRGNGQINQFAFTGWLPVPTGTCRGAGTLLY